MAKGVTTLQFLPCESLAALRFAAISRADDGVPQGRFEDRLGAGNAYLPEPLHLTILGRVCLTLR